MTGLQSGFNPTSPGPRRPFHRRIFRSGSVFSPVRCVLPMAGIVACLGALLLASGCATEEAAVEGGMVDSSVAEREAAARTAAEEVEAMYVIGPAAARAMGYRIAWQYPASTGKIRRFAVQDDSVFTLDHSNFLSKIRREKGDRMWQVPVGGGPMQQIQGITYVPSEEKVYLTANSQLMVLDVATGSQIAKQKLGRIAATEPFVLGQYFVYGSRRGQVVWHSYLMDSERAGYQVSQSMRQPPLYEDGYIVAVGSAGEVMCLRAGSISQVWSRKALAPIVADAVAGNGAVYVASLDQHLRAFELAENRSPLWEYLTESPLTDSPVLIGDRVYQQVESEGLVCLEALPLDSPGGVVIWQAKDAGGNVLTQMRDTLITWDADDKELAIVDSRLGAPISSFHLPHIDSIMATEVVGGDIYATAMDGRILRLVPRN